MADTSQSPPASPPSGSGNDAQVADESGADVSADSKALARHRRTRSGCYTCRKRRVKCDEGRPCCQRCLKGNRECLFPPERLTISKKQRTFEARKMKRAAAAAILSGIKDTPMVSPDIVNDGSVKDDDVMNALDSDESAITSPMIGHGSAEPKHGMAESAELDVLGSLASTYAIPTSCLKGDPTMSFPHVPPEIARLLQYHRDNLCHCHYFLSTDAINFFDRLLDMAYLSSPLMFALAAFASYHYALRYGESQIQAMFIYYEKCVKSLITAVESPDLYTLVSILILSCIEMYLGDVSNEIHHQDAVFNLFKSMYTPETAFQTDMQVYFFVWLRFIDVRRSIVSGRNLTLGSEWQGPHRQAVHERLIAPERLTGNLKVHTMVASLGVMFSDLCELAVNVRENKISGSQAVRRIELLRAKSLSWFGSLDPSIFETDTISADSGISEEDLQLVPPLLYKEWRVGLLMIIFNGYKLYFSSYAALSSTGRIQDPEATSEIAFLMARLFAGFEATQTEHPGTLFACHNYLCIAASFMPARLHDWVRRKLALIQALGYYFPEQVRMKLASTWNNQDLYRGWLEGLDPIDEKPKNVVIPWQRLLQVKIPEFDVDRENFTAAVSEMRGIFDTGVTKL